MTHSIVKLITRLWGGFFIKDIISVSLNKCKQCYACVRSCPVKAIKINNGQAEIISSRCINCGKCTTSCPQSAKIVINYKQKTLDMLKSKSEVIACLAPSFIASFHEISYKKVVGALKKMGFSQVWETAVGAEVLSFQIDNYIKQNKSELYISSPCPSFVTTIEKHYPELIKHLLPFVSPMIATGRIIRDKFPNKDIKIVFIGPCISKKAESNDPQFEGIINSVLTFDELKELFLQMNMDMNNVEEYDFDSVYCSKGRLFPLSGGLLKNLEITKNLKASEYTFIDNDKECLKLIDAISKDKPALKLVDVLMCKGCIEGPKINSELTYYEKVKKIYQFYETRKDTTGKINTNINLLRHYRNRRNILPFPTEEEIKNVLIQTNKLSKDDELNCGACGYNTCRDKAIAVLQGIAEVDMCLPYLLAKKSSLLEDLSQKLSEITSLKEELETTIESSYDGLVITDGQGKIVRTNKAWYRIIGCKESLTAELVQNIENKNIIFPSATLLALKEKRRISFIQNGENGKHFLATATPILDDEGNIKRVVSNIRDIEELKKLEQQINETRKLEKYHNRRNIKLEKLDFENENLVVNSMEFGQVLHTASNVAAVDSTVLILGESGVGKEVVAQFIRNLSRRKNKPFVKINCGAIPENLIESELFGYETGAFTGARSRGKPGLIELSHEGTLFLDEIGDLPINLQVKLLRVIQERKLVRIGGTEEREVDVRIISATNKDLYQMVLNGKFRADLYYRLNVVPIEVPPLRKRKSDILPLSYHFIDMFNKKYLCNKQLTSSVERILLQYNWPGNVRELQNIIERLVVTTGYDTIEERDLPLFLFENKEEISKKIKVDGIMPLKEAVELVEKKIIESACKRYSTTYEMAEALGVNQSTIVRKIQKYMDNNAYRHD
ncbi:sigma 54-interacting transcriptional regulator [Brassicibacter mesophilus]|uniref:sigma 54-interacting transcriptional regulator n=1 Tax=Brassicibacter mesophilus TaxID=745119 RepID=UPI003D212702